MYLQVVRLLTFHCHFSLFDCQKEGLGFIWRLENLHGGVWSHQLSDSLYDFRGYLAHSLCHCTCKWAVAMLSLEHCNWVFKGQEPIPFVKSIVMLSFRRCLKIRVISTFENLNFYNWIPLILGFNKWPIMHFACYTLFVIVSQFLTF